ncbi:MAG: hypothetical protein ABUS49_11950 [Acidobacteriota bacterium]
MALATALLIKGQNEAVLAYFDKCDQIGWSKSDQLDGWRAAVRSGNVPDFPKVTLAY